MEVLATIQIIIVENCKIWKVKKMGKKCQQRGSMLCYIYIIIVSSTPHPFDLISLVVFCNRPLMRSTWRLT